jgi:tRNA A-37 threonylcarbamoyl transferase component Bud32/predicted esterase
MNLETETAFTGEERPPPPPALTPAQLQPHFPQLEILEYLGRGGMGVVYKARQKSLNRTVAIKLLAPERVRDPKFGDRFAREAQALAQLNHPNIVTVHDFGQAGGFYYLLMEFVDGVNLRHLLRARKLQPAEALAIVPPVCEALQYAHNHRIVHCDIKPENLLLDKEGRVKIADFGIAKMLGAGSPAAASESQAAGTPQYMAPEQLAKPTEADHRADIYSLGVVLYEMLTGELPAPALLPPSRKVVLDVRLDEIVLRALEKEPELRYQQASQFKTQVETVSMSATRAGSATEGVDGARIWVRIGAWLAFALAVPVVGLGVFFLIALLEERGNWHPSRIEAIVVFLTWLGCVSLPVAGWFLWRRGSSRQESVGNAGLGRLMPARAPAILAAFGLAGLVLTAATFVVLLAVSAVQAERARAAEAKARQAAMRAQLAVESARITNPEAGEIPMPEDIRDVPIIDRRAGGDEKKRYFLIGRRADGPPPAQGYRLLIVLPGGDGSANFSPFVRRIYQQALDENWLIAQLVAPTWEERQKNRLVWPTAADAYPAAQFTTEQFVETVVTEIEKELRLDARRIFTLSWSSGGPAGYAISLNRDTRVSGSFIAMSIFRSEQSPVLSNAKGKAYYLLQSPEDKVTRFEHALKAEAVLTNVEAKVRLQAYAGGHGWRGNVYENIRAGITWLEQATNGRPD